MNSILSFRNLASRQVNDRLLPWIATAVLTLAIIGCGGSVDALASSAPDSGPSNASPSDVYQMYQEHQRQQKEELTQAVEALRPLADGDHEEELERARNEILESTDPETMTPFISRGQAQRWQSMPADERNAWFAMYLSEESFPSQLEVRSETIDGDQATLDVRGYFDEVDDGEPGWTTGTITLVMEEGSWKVDDESWDWAPTATDGTPEPSGAGAECGSFEVSGDVERVVDTATVSASNLASHGGWSFRLGDDGYVVIFQSIPMELAAGEYPFAAEMPSVPYDWDGETPLDFPMHVVFAERGEYGLEKTWDDDITGMLTVEAIEGGRISGHFQFTDGSVKVLGSFCNVEVPASP